MMDNKRLVNGGATKKQLREEKRQLKQIGNQQKRTREKAALRDLLGGDIDAIPDFEYDRPTETMNGLDRAETLKEHWCKEKLDFCRPDGTNEAHQELLDDGAVS